VFSTRQARHGKGRAAHIHGRNILRSHTREPRKVDVLTLQPRGDLRSEEASHAQADDRRSVAEQPARELTLACTTDLLLLRIGEPRRQPLPLARRRLRGIAAEHASQPLHALFLGTAAAVCSSRLIEGCIQLRSNAVDVGRGREVFRHQGNPLAAERNAGRVGNVEEVLVEGPSRTDATFLRGRTRRNMAVNFTGDAQAGQLVDVRIDRATSQTLGGEQLAVVAV